MSWRAAGLVMLCACGGSSGAAAPAAVEAPPRAGTAGDALLALVPEGADIVFELDLARLRANEAVGAAVTTLAGGDGFGLATSAGFDLVRDADAVLLASYKVGSAEAATITLVRGDRLGHLRDARRIDDRTAVLGPPALLDQVEAAAAGAGPAMAGDPTFLRLRTEAMPEAAPGAFVRLTARLDFDSRVAMASRFGLDAVPATVSLWGDVADDLAVVALLGGDDSRNARQIAGEVEAWRRRWSAAPVLSVVVRTLVSAVEVAPHGEAARAVLVIGPRRLEKLVERATPAAVGAR